MSEAYPVFQNNLLFGFVASSSEFTILGLVGSGRKLLLWSGGEAHEIQWRRYTLPEGYTLDPGMWATYAPLTTWRSFESIEEYAKWLAGFIGERLRGKRLLLSFSGGKDSTTALLVLDKLYDLVGFKLEVVHVHLPFIEPEYHVKEVERIASRLGYNVTILEPPRRVFARRLLNEGLPWRRARWCTYYKTRPIEEYFEKIDADYMVVGDRIGESLTRSKRLKPSDFFDRRRFEPIKYATLADVVIAVRETGLVHTDYMKGLLRVSCRYCPYKGIAELLVEGREGEEDPGLIDEVLRIEWRRWYRDYIPYDVFIEEHLWRYTPRIARMFYLAKRLLRGQPVLKPADVAKLHRSIWEVDISCLKRLPMIPIKSRVRA